jgi:transcriptional regulator with XRE-family HTH domain
MTTSPSSSARQAREALGADLRELRKEAGLTARRLAVATGQHYTRVSKIENGIQAPTDRDIRAWCRECNAEDQIPDLVATLRSVESAYLELRRQSRAGMKRVIGAHTPDLYQRTTHFRIYEHNVIPGLFQTAAYCSAMLSFWVDFLKAPNDISEAVASRLEKQQVIYRSGKRFAVVLEEQALRTWFGTAEVQIGQLDRLIALMSMPNISIGIIPLMTERTAVGSAGFWIFDDALVALETPSASIEVNRPREVTLYAKMFAELQASAVHGPAARELISAVIDETAQRL